MRKWWPLVAICLGTFMLLIDVTIVNVALPAMASDLHTSFTSLQWVVDGYALALAALLLGIGSIADLAGHRRSYLAGLTLFAVSSAVCGLAPNATVLIAARVVQGIGGAAMFATTTALLNKSYQGRDRGVAFGWWGAVSGAAAAVGPILGGLLVQGISWRWIFFVNLPISAAAIGMTLRFLTPDAGGSRRRVDIPGMLTFTVAAGSLTYALIRANDHGWSTASTYGLVTLAAVSLAGFLAIEARSDAAMLDLGLFRRRPFVGTMVAALVINFAAFACLTYSSIWLQTVDGLSPIEAGLTGLPLAGAAFIVSATVGKHLHGSPGPAIGGGMLLVGVGSLLDALLLHGSASWPALIPGYAIVGAGVGFAMPSLVSSAMGAVPVERGGMAGGAVNTARQLGYAVGIAVLGTLFSSGAASSLTSSGHGAGSRATAHALAGGQAPRLLGEAGSGRAALHAVFETASLHGLDYAFVAAGIAGLVAGALALVLVRPVKGGGAAPGDRTPGDRTPGDHTPAGAASGATQGNSEAPSAAPELAANPVPA